MIDKTALCKSKLAPHTRETFEKLGMLTIFSLTATPVSTYSLSSVLSKHYLRFNLQPPSSKALPPKEFDEKRKTISAKIITPNSLFLCRFFRGKTPRESC